MQPAAPTTRSMAVTGLVVLLTFLLTALGSVFTTQAGEHRTVFLPLKINAPNPAALRPQADKAMSDVLAQHAMVLLSRQRAKQVLNNQGAWPPPPETLKKVAEKTGADYVATGSLTQVGNKLSVDMEVYDVLSPAAPFTTFKEGPADQEITGLIEAAVSDLVGYTKREFQISTIGTRGNKLIDSSAILGKISSKPGDIYDPSRLRQDLKAVYGMGSFDNVEIDVTNKPTGKEVVFVVKEKPVLSQIIVSGNDAIDEDDIRDAANISDHAILNPAQINSAVQRIKELYKSKGYYNTKVKAKLSYPDPEHAEVRFVIQEGKKLSIRKIAFQGNKAYDDDDLEDVIQTGTWNWFSWLTDTGVLKADVLKQDAARLASFYHNHGYIEAKVGEPVVQEQGDGLAITFPIEEGPRYRVGTVDIQGDLIENKAKMLASLNIRKEPFLNRKVLRQDALKLTDLYAEHGYAFADIQPEVKRSKTSKRVDIVLHVDKGALVHFNRVEIRGNTRTRDNVIRRDLEIKEGGVFDSKAIRESTRKLRRLGFFEEVNITPKPTLQEDQMNVTVDVKEKSTGQFSIGAGYSSYENFMFMAEISENNLMGTGNRLSLAANLSAKTTRFNLSFTNPRIFDSHLSTGIDLFNWERDYDDYTKKSTGGGLRFGHPFFEKWYIYYGYSIADTELSDLSENASEIIIRSKDIKLTSSIHMSLVRDTRDRFFAPTKGSRNSISVKYAGGILGGDAQFTKVEGYTSWYFPMIWKTVFHVKAAAGQAFENEDNKLPVYEHFYLGGMNTIRGFDSSSISPRDPETNEKIGGDKMWYANISIMYPLVKDAGLYGEIFTDFGNVYGVDDDWDLSDYKKTAGFGFLWMSPMGPLRLAWGYNLDRKEGEDSSNWDFSIGSTF